MKKLYLIIHNVRSAHNVGSLFRTADGMGVSKIYLTGYTPTPIDRFKREDMRIAKVSLGAENVVPWEQGVIAEVITKLKNEEIEITVLEQVPRSIELSKYVPQKDVALIVGNEIVGVEEEVLTLVDTVLEIPMKGEKESLNVSNAGSIALYVVSNLLYR